MRRDTLVLRLIEAGDLQDRAGQPEVAQVLWRAAQQVAAERFEVARRRHQERLANLAHGADR